jgi:hypothetical protein
MVHVSTQQGCNRLEGMCGTTMMLQTDQPSQLLPTPSRLVNPITVRWRARTSSQMVAYGKLPAEQRHH